MAEEAWKVEEAKEAEERYMMTAGAVAWTTSASDCVEVEEKAG